MNKIETKKQRIVNAKTLIVAIDIGKTTDTGYCRCSSGEECKPFEFSNNAEGFKKLWDRICWMKMSQKDLSRLIPFRFLVNKDVFKLQSRHGSCIIFVSNRIFTAELAIL